MSNSPGVQLLPRLISAFSMKTEDITETAQNLYQTASEAWLETLNNHAVQVGCRNQFAVGPFTQDAVYLANMCRADAEKIAQTWNNDIARVLNQQFQVNRRSNRLDYLGVLEPYTEGRYIWKSKQIAVQTVQKTKSYASQRFYTMNGLTEGQYIYAGPPPVSDICKMRTAMGVVDFQTTLDNPTPAHQGPCIHSWELIGRVRVPCNRLWLGQIA